MSKCPDCMNEWDERMCASCGYRPGAPVVTPNALPNGMTLANRYTLGNALGFSRQSIAYAAWDHQMNQRVIITEFFPAVIVKRIHGAVAPQRNQAQFQVAMNRYQSFGGQLALPLTHAFFGNDTAYRVYATAEQPPLKIQAEMLLDQPILFRDEKGRAQMTINALVIDPLPQERPFARAGKPGKKKKQKALVAIFAMLVLLAAGGVFVLPKLSNQDVPVQGNLTAELPTAVPTALTAMNTQAPTNLPPTAQPVPTAMPVTAIPATARPTSIPATPAPTATAVPTLEPSIDIWYCKVNDQIFRINADNGAEAVTGDASHMKFDQVEILNLTRARMIYGVSKISLRNEDAQTEMDITDQIQNLKLELQPGNYTLILQRSAEFSENLKLERAKEVSFHSGVGLVDYTEEAEAELTAWYTLFDEVAAPWAENNARKHDQLLLNGDCFYVLNGVYYQAGRQDPLSNEAECFYLAGTEDLLAELKIPLYPVKIHAQKLDRNVFDRAILHTQDGDVDITDLLLNAEGNEIFYISQGSYQIDIQLKPIFAIQNLFLNDQQLHVGESGELPLLDEMDLKAQVFRNAGLWASQLGENEPVIYGTGAHQDQEMLWAAFGGLITENPEFALHPVSFESAHIAFLKDNQSTQKFLSFKSARVSRSGVNIALDELMLSAMEMPAEMAAEIPGAENDNAELPEGMALAAVAATPAPQPTVEDLPAVVEIAAIEGLKLTAGEYAFYPMENTAVQFSATDAMPVKLGAQMQPVQMALLNQLAQNGVGYVAHVEKENDGQFVYQHEDEQMRFTAAELTAMNSSALSTQEKYTVTVDCALQFAVANNLTLQDVEKEKASLGIVYVGPADGNSANPVELKFSANEELENKEMVALADLAQWNGDLLTLKLGPGKYRLYYRTLTTVQGEDQASESIKFSDAFSVTNEHQLALGKRCEHKWVKAREKAPEFARNCLIYIYEKCSICGEYSEKAPEEDRAHNFADATCERPKTCSRCGRTTGGPLGHAWKDATCTAPETCSRCGETTGSAKGHDWKDATCTAPETCSRCDETRGSAKGHDWKDANCESPKTCKRCSATSGNSLGHDWTDATCTTPKTCGRCKKTEGGTGKHSYGEWYEDRPVSCKQQQRLAHKCKTCGKVETKAGTPALGHDYNWGGVCKRCGEYFAAHDHSSNNNSNNNGNSGSGSESSGSSESSSSGSESSGSGGGSSSSGGESSGSGGESSGSGGESSGSSESSSSGGGSSSSGGESSGSGSGSSSSGGESGGSSESGSGSSGSGGESAGGEGSSSEE